MKEYQKWGITLGVTVLVFVLLSVIFYFIPSWIGNKWFDGDYLPGAIITMVLLFALGGFLKLILIIHDIIWNDNNGDYIDSETGSWLH